ncbi:MAG: hypothetical protein J6W75_12630 [Bacteroidaceae bacterium]|nr:hypothetical protein [Bacteroidaceae bacterium]
MIINRFIPFAGFTAINLFGIIFVRKGKQFTPTDLCHERIHTRQMLELLFLPFYLFYFIEWSLRLLKVHNGLRAYQEISFEREAYAHQSDPEYINKRQPYAWLRYLSK